MYSKAMRHKLKRFSPMTDLLDAFGEIMRPQASGGLIGTRSDVSGDLLSVVVELVPSTLGVSLLPPAPYDGREPTRSSVKVVAKLESEAQGLW